MEIPALEEAQGPSQYTLTWKKPPSSKTLMPVLSKPMQRRAFPCYSHTIDYYMEKMKGNYVLK